jgi:NAD(P)-dependent dehydrogenase (short-subunit alcohol dehydrogenase family)
VTLLVYPATKALTMLTTQYARSLDGILVNAADPGYTGTDFNDHRGAQTVTEGTDAIVHLATLPADGPTGAFQDARHRCLVDHDQQPHDAAHRALDRSEPAAAAVHTYPSHRSPRARAETLTRVRG